MNITVNGEQFTDLATCSVSDLLKTLDLQHAFIAVAINNTCISRSQYERTMIQNNDKVEILAPMAGG